MSEISVIVDEIHAAVAVRDGDAIEMWIEQFELSFDGDHWPDELFAAVKELLQDNRFLATGPSWHLASLVARCWSEITADQRSDLAEIWPIAFGRFGDWLGAFVVAEILGERYADEDALRVLDHLSRTAPLPHRALAGYGLGQLARTVKSGALYDSACRRLRELTVDRWPDVRTEASDALRMLDRKLM